MEYVMAPDSYMDKFIENFGLNHVPVDAYAEAEAEDIMDGVVESDDNSQSYEEEEEESEDSEYEEEESEDVGNDEEEAPADDEEE